MKELPSLSLCQEAVLRIPRKGEALEVGLTAV